MNTQVAPGDRAYGVPHPGTFILSRNGHVVARYFEDSYQVRNTVASIALMAGHASLRGPGTAVSTEYLDVVGFASDEVVAPGTRFSLVLDVTPKPGMHVYAPGQSGYQPIALSVKDEEAITVEAGRYPMAETYRFKPLNESVQVYSKPFRVTHPVTVRLTPRIREQAKVPGATLGIHATLAFQACDAERCYLPQAVPLSWTLRLKPLESP